MNKLSLIAELKGTIDLLTDEDVISAYVDTTSYRNNKCLVKQRNIVIHIKLKV